MTSDCILTNDHLSLSVATIGAEMQFLRTADGRDLLWHGDATFWTGRAPVLFPIVGRAPDDTIAVGAHHANMPQHGFARRSPFAIETQTPTMCRHVLRADAATRAVYPFEFTLRLTHALSGPTVSVTAEVENLSDQPMPFGFGFHPAFLWPLPGATDQTHMIKLPATANPKQRPLRPDGLLEPDLVPGPFQAGTLPLSEALFEEGALVFPDGTPSLLRYGSKDGPNLSFTFDNLPDIALWKPKQAPFLCIEPWHGTAALHGAGPQIADRPNSTTLQPGTQETFGYSVTVAL
ncbi:aldose 1-epimerase family protein [Shimia marina]|uniref:Aldose 1-epimerase n=1 Tax=Shimia marina TaxID=321267 RepID=A0A0P1EQV1_9RHOB|nr:aldose 1-epimerase family protein [Shimia marina]CUH52617.1 Aldose 1-epimerase [Shimia marina]SFE51775.1 Galactose mutarotase [Shimia marina]